MFLKSQLENTSFCPTSGIFSDECRPSILSFRIFDRWGDVVFETSEMPVIWNGWYKNKESNPGVYVYGLDLNRNDGEIEILSADITLIR